MTTRDEASRESRFLSTPPAFDALVMGGGPRQNIAITFGMEKPEWCGYQMVKNVENMFTNFDRIHERDGRIDRRTPRDGIGRAYG